MTKDEERSQIKGKQPTVASPIEPVVSLPLAIWTLELNCKCPKCDADIDLLEDGDFWEENRIQACEHGTKQSKNIDAWCKDCEHEFKVDLAY